MLTRRKGFTLIELLVVIAIIAVLAAILFPIFTTATQTSYKSVCIEHGKQLGSALMQYMSAWDDTFPKQEFIDNYWAEGNTNPPGYGPEDLLPFDLRVKLRPYCRSMQIWNCKAFYTRFGVQTKYAWNWKTGVGYTSWIYHGLNGRNWDPEGLGDPYEPKVTRLSSIVMPSRKCAFYDAFFKMGKDDDYIPHMGATILVYVDGHVRLHRIISKPATLEIEGYRYPP